ncbi:MAG: 2-isopropylmalate synthase [Pseudanabaena sp. ELA607]|jgi:2-isopropylmalate synthase
MINQRVSLRVIMIKVLDSTLREGEQTPGVYFEPKVKLAIAQLLDQIGVDIIEAGNPAVDPEIATSVKQIAQLGLSATIGAHSLCRLDHVQQSLDCGVGFLGVFLSVSKQRLQQDYGIGLGKAIDSITAAITYARSQKPNLLIRYTPEDTVRSPIGYVIEAATAAVQAGANIISIADTTGYATPFQTNRSLAWHVRTIRDGLAEVGLYPQIEVHCHNDRGLALANALDACSAGVNIVDTCVLGIGERAGIVDLAQLLINLQDSFGMVNHWDLSHLGTLYQLVSHHSYIGIAPNFPIVGGNAFTHYAGVHVKAVVKDEALYQSLDPNLVGSQSMMALGLQSGRSAVELALKQIGKSELIADQALVTQALHKVKTMAKRGRPIEIEAEFAAIVEGCLRERLSQH